MHLSDDLIEADHMLFC